nr:hypothetical protein KitaXyl93_42630 [Kitasatospora sp. Xyl93]
MLNSHPRISDVAEAWRSLDPRRSLLNAPEWVETSEDDSPDSARYAVHHDADGQPNASVAVFRVDGNMFRNYDPVEVLLDCPEDAHENVAPEEVARLTALQDEASALLRDAMRPAAVCMLPGAYLPGIIRTATDAQTIHELLDTLDRAAQDWGARSTAVMHVPAEDSQLDQILRERGYVSSTVTAQCVIPVPGKSFEDYLATFGRKRRYKILRERRVFAESGIKTRWAGPEVLEDEAMVAEMGRLQSEQLRQYGHDIPAERMVALLRRIKEHLSPWCRVLVAERDGVMEAFVLSYADAESLYPKMVGWSDYAQRNFAYFNMVYYEQVAYASEQGLSQIVAGPETYDAKVHRGGVLHQRRMYVRAMEQETSVLVSLAEALDRVHQARLNAYVS